MGSTQFEDTASAAEAAAESAKQAIAAAQAAAYLANKSFNQTSQQPGFNASGINPGYGVLPRNSMGVANDPLFNYQNLDHGSKGPGQLYEPHSFDRSQYPSNEETRSVRMNGDEHICRRHSYNETRPIRMGGQDVHRRHSYNASSPNSEIKFDESDCDEEIEIEDSPAAIYPPPQRHPPPVPSSNVDPAPRVHPKLPDYDTLAARFEALKYHRSQT